MIQQETVINIADNTGALSVLCIRVLGGTKRRYARIGDIIVGTVKRASTKKDGIKSGTIVRVVVVRTKKETKRANGTVVSFTDNAGVVITNDNEPVGSSISGPVGRELRAKGFNKIISRAPEVR